MYLSDDKCLEDIHLEDEVLCGIDHESGEGTLKQRHDDRAFGGAPRVQPTLKHTA